MNTNKQPGELVAGAMRGEEVIIIKDGEPIARAQSVAPIPLSPRFGSAQGKIEMAPDFDAPLDDFADYAP
jgi:antitoxin (DNA-binding transcriptional repressor) of toxin-antitoxin stability system